MATVKEQMSELRDTVNALAEIVTSDHAKQSPAEQAVSAKAKAKPSEEREELIRQSVVINPDKGTTADIVGYLKGDAVLVAYQGPRSYHPIGGRREVLEALYEVTGAMLEATAKASKV